MSASLIDGRVTSAAVRESIKAECAACTEGADALLIKGKDRLIGETVKGFNVRLGDAAVTCKATGARRRGGLGGGEVQLHAQSFRIRKFRHAACGRCALLTL